MNVAIHLQNLGVETAMISRVGKDELGEELLAFLRERKVNTEFVQIDDKLGTGIVNVMLDARKNATYTIVRDVAWDQIDHSFVKTGLKPKYVIHGSLACRSERSKNSLLKIVDTTDAKIVFDLNLRAPYFNPALIEGLMGNANIVKMNEEEYDLVKRWLQINKSTMAEEFNALTKAYPNLETLIITMGGNGALAWHDGKTHSVPGVSVTVEDTIGSGDAFLGGFLSEYDKGVSLNKALEFAAATGAYVASRSGANPEYSREDVLRLMK